MLGLGLIIAKKERKERRGVVARAPARDGEHLIPVCNAGEGGDQALDEVLAVAPFLVLRRYLILNLS